MNKEDIEIVHRGVRIRIDQDEDLISITEKVKLTAPKRRYSVTLREALDEGLTILKEKYGIR